MIDLRKESVEVVLPPQLDSGHSFPAAQITPTTLIYKIFQTRYRIVTDRYAGFEAQFRVWWWPCWMQINGMNTFPSAEAAERFIRNHVDEKRAPRTNVVKYVDLG